MVDKAMNKHAIILSIVSIVNIVRCHAEDRTWKDASGSYQVEAEFVEVQDGAVKLRKSDGTTVLVPLALLSASDQQYVEAVVQADSPDRTASDAATTPADKPTKRSARLWTDRVTKQQVEATFIEMKKDGVLVERPDGKRAQIPLDRISDEDQQYIWNTVWVHQDSSNEDAKDDVQRKAEADTDHVAGDRNDASDTGDASNGVMNPDPGEKVDVNHWNEAIDALREWIGSNLRHDQFARWLTPPLRSYTIGVWVGLAILTSIQAFMLGRSWFGWFILGLILPGVAIFILPLIGEEGILPLHPRSRAIFALRLGVGATSFAGLGTLASLVIHLDGFTTTALHGAMMAIQPSVMGSFAGLWLLNVLMSGMLATILHRSVLVWYLLSAFVPFVGSLLLAFFGRSKRATTPWAMICPVQGDVCQSHIDQMKAAGQIDGSAVVVCGNAIWETGRESYQWAELLIIGLVEMQKRLPANLADIPLNPRLHIADGATMLVFTSNVGEQPTTPAPAPTSAVDQRPRSPSPIVQQQKPIVRSVTPQPTPQKLAKPTTPLKKAPAKQIQKIHQAPAPTPSRRFDVNRSDPVGQILDIDKNLVSILHDPKTRDEAIHWSNDMVKVLPDLKVGLFNRCETEEDAKAWAWRHLAAVIWCLTHKVNDTPFRGAFPTACPAAEKCLEQALKLVKKFEFRRQMEDDYKNLTGRTWD